jgi:prevent-host-death family protein
MSKTIDITELQKDVEHVIDEVEITKTSIVLTRNHKPSAVMIPYEDYIKMLSQGDVWGKFEAVWQDISDKNAAYTDDEIAADLKLATEEVRNNRRAQKL